MPLLPPCTDNYNGDCNSSRLWGINSFPQTAESFLAWHQPLGLYRWDPSLVQLLAPDSTTLVAHPTWSLAICRPLFRPWWFSPVISVLYAPGCTQAISGGSSPCYHPIRISLQQRGQNLKCSGMAHKVSAKLFEDTDSCAVLMLPSTWVPCHSCNHLLFKCATNHCHN